MEAKKCLDVADLLLKLAKQRVEESQRLLRLGASVENNQEVSMLLKEADLLRIGVDIAVEASKS